jgi:prolyl-tRNA synthetase
MSTQDEYLDKMKVTLNKENFSEWYNNVIDLANLSDKRYPIKGMNVWTPYGWKLMRNIDEHIRSEMDATGHDEVCFPLLIPKTEFAKEAEHIKGFDAEVYWVTHGGVNELDVPLLLRPTSETAMYPVFGLWIRSHSDLPLKTYQLVNVFRYETKQTRSFIRIREIHFFEAHTCHSDFEDAERQVQEDIEIWKRLSKQLCLPSLLTKRPDWDKFAGAFYTIGLDCIMPMGRALQLGSIHQYKENFSKPYNILYEDENGEHKHVHQTTYGMSERLIGAIVGVHGDNKGIILPPAIAPYQVVIIPILSKKSRDLVTSECENIRDELKNKGIRSHIDDRDIRPGNKFYDWELRGVPLRLELGPRDIESNSVVIVRRDTGYKQQVSRESLADSMLTILDTMAQELYSAAEQKLQDGITDVDSMEDAKDVTGIVKMGWCGEEECGLMMAEYIDKDMLGVPIDEEVYQGQCGQCGKPTETAAYFAKAL